AFLHTGEGMVYQDVAAGDIHLELHHGSTAWANGNGLYALAWRCNQVAIAVYAVEDFTNHVEARGRIRATHTEENTYGVIKLRFHHVSFCERIHGAVKG